MDDDHYLVHNRQREAQSLSSAFTNWKFVVHIPVEEMIRHIGSRFDLARDLTPPREANGFRIHSLYLQRQSHLRRAARLTSLSSSLSSAERMVEAYFRGNPTGRNQEQAPAVVDDRDSFSSIAAVINSKIQMDTTAEIDSLVSHSASSRRRNDVLRVSETLVRTEGDD